MATKRTATKAGTTARRKASTRGPIVDRPDIPYGLRGPKEGAGLLPWSRASDRLRASYIYWVSTTRKDGRPHSIPVWGIWLDDTLYFSNGAQTARNLARDPRVSVHLESGEDAVVIEGAVEMARGKPLIKRINLEYNRKYLWEGAQDEWFALRPQIAFGWLAPSVGLGTESVYTGSATRWRFPGR
jgi:pyridoxamine 5'-phosphate oxidase-like protein